MSETAVETPPETKTVQYYEGMFLVDSNRFAGDPDGVTNHVLGLLKKVGATIVTHRPWQDGRLAYEIDGRRKGLHLLAYFQMENSTELRHLSRACKLSDVVIRYLVIKHPKMLFDAMVTAISADEENAEGEDDGGSDGTDG